MGFGRVRQGDRIPLPATPLRGSGVVFWEWFAALKRWANQHCASGASEANQFATTKPPTRSRELLESMKLLEVIACAFARAHPIASRTTLLPGEAYAEKKVIRAAMQLNERSGEAGRSSLEGRIRRRSPRKDGEAAGDEPAFLRREGWR
jgi:hypothetical protein